MKIKNKYLENILLAASVIICSIGLVVANLSFGKLYKQRGEKLTQPLEIAKQDIVAEYGFGTVLWLDAEKVKNLEGRDDFYIFTCLVEEDELHEYRFAVVVKDINGEIDIDTWMIKEGG